MIENHSMFVLLNLMVTYSTNISKVLHFEILKHNQFIRFMPRFINGW